MEELDQTLTSLEVAEMVGKKHCDLMRDIRRYCNQMNVANEKLGAERKIALGDSAWRKIELVDFFKESTYLDENNQTRPCYNITKKGCEFIAHKLTGVKGTAFTARYINRFYEMKQYIKTTQGQRSQSVQQGNYPSLVNKWMHEQEPNFRFICKAYGISRRELYHKILLDIGDEYSVDDYRAYYKRDTGHGAEYIMDVVSYYKELREAAEVAIEIHLRRIRMRPKRFLIG